MAGHALPDAVQAASARDLPGALPEQARLIGEGWNARAYRVPCAAGDWVVRVPLSDVGSDDIERQARLGPLLRAHEIPVPEETRVLRWRGDVVAGAHRFLRGQEARPRRPSSRRALERELGALIATLHSIPRDAAVDHGARSFDLLAERYRPLVGEYAFRFAGRSRIWLRSTLRRLESTQAGGAWDEALVHGDLAPAHLLCRGEGETLRIVGVLDFSGPWLTDPALDFARLIQHWGAPFAERVLKTYAERRPIDESFLTRASLYSDLEPLRTVAVALDRERPEMERWGRRRIAARAGRATRG